MCAKHAIQAHVKLKEEDWCQQAGVLWNAADTEASDSLSSSSLQSYF